MELLGRIVGYIVTWFLAIVRGRALWFMVAVAAVVLASPWVANYWLDHVHVPEVSLSVNVFMLVSTVFLLTFTVSIYAIVQLMLQIRQNQRQVGAPSPFSAVPIGIKPTGGDFIPTDDVAIREREDLAILKSQGILHETDVEGLASEIGHATLRRTRGRTED